MKPLISALGLIAAGSLILIAKKFITENQPIIQKQTLKQILIILRKRVFSTLREFAYIVNNIKTNQQDFQPMKISDIVMKDGGTGDAKLHLIEELTLQNYNVTKQSFEASCNFYKIQDYQIRLLTKNLSMDIEFALKGTIQDYNGPQVNISPNKVIQIYREILQRRLSNIKQKILNNISNEQIMKKEFMIEQYLDCQGIKHQKQPNQKIFISILEKNYRDNSDFRILFENLQIEMNQFRQEIQQEQLQKHLKQIQQKQFQNTLYQAI